MSEKYHVRERQAAYCRCGKPATHEVRNSRNAVMDWMCKKDALPWAKRMNDEEAQRVVSAASRGETP